MNLADPATEMVSRMALAMSTAHMAFYNQLEVLPAPTPVGRHMARAALMTLGYPTEIMKEAAKIRLKPDGTLEDGEDGLAIFRRILVAAATI